jgi:hypothetical protein
MTVKRKGASARKDIKQSTDENQSQKEQQQLRTKLCKERNTRGLLNAKYRP